jgi:DNA-binding GntR family transcriptional regulator
MPDPRAYVRLAASLRDDITSGALAPGEALPSIAELRRKYGHSRQTAGKAMKTLQRDGLIYKVPGLVYYVPDPADEPSAQPPRPR